jgi:hypothetical protein
LIKPFTTRIDLLLNPSLKLSSDELCGQTGSMVFEDFLELRYSVADL